MAELHSAKQGGSYVVGADGEEVLVGRTKAALLPHEKEEAPAEAAVQEAQEAQKAPPKSKRNEG